MQFSIFSYILNARLTRLIWLVLTEIVELCLRFLELCKLPLWMVKFGFALAWDCGQFAGIRMHPVLARNFRGWFIDHNPPDSHIFPIKTRTKSLCHVQPDFWTERSSEIYHWFICDHPLFFLLPLIAHSCCSILKS